MKRYEIEIFGWGSEIVVGTINSETLDAINDAIEENGLDDTSELFYDVWEYDDSGTLTDWYEYDNIFHSYGPMPLGSKIVVTDLETGEEVFSKPFEELVNYDEAEYIEEYHEVEEDAILLGRTEDKGLTFQTEIEIDGDFDEKLFTFNLTGVEVEDDGEYTIVTDFKYDGEEIYNENMATDGKSFDVYVYE